MYFRRLAELRTDHDLSQRQLAEIIGMNRETYQRYEVGTREIPVWLLIRLAEYYGVSVDYILGLSDRKRSV